MALPNYYQPYGTFQNYVPMYQQQANYQPVQQSTQFPQQTTPVINGKIVDGIDSVKGLDIPIGSYMVCPKADSSSIFIKSWTQEGTTKIDEYTKVKPQKEETTDLNSMLEDIYSSINALSKKIDNIKLSSSQNTSVTSMKRKKVDEDE